MEKQIINWWKQAERDFTAAKKNFDIREFYVCAFLCQQAVEKALKALAIKDRHELVKSHSVTRLGRLLQLPEELINKISELEPVYQETRYPDVSFTIPAEEFEREDVTTLLSIASEVLEWIEKKIK